METVVSFKSPPCGSGGPSGDVFSAQQFPVQLTSSFVSFSFSSFPRRRPPPPLPPPPPPPPPPPLLPRPPLLDVEIWKQNGRRFQSVSAATFSAPDLKFIWIDSNPIRLAAAIRLSIESIIVQQNGRRSSRWSTNEPIHWQIQCIGWISDAVVDYRLISWM